MAEHIQCINCDSPICDGCNLYVLSKMLDSGKFDCIMDEHCSINPTADVAEVVRCKDCKYCEMCFPCKAFGLEAPPVYVCRLFDRNREVLPNDYCNFGAKMDGKGEGK